MVPKIHAEHMQISNVRVGLNNTRKPSTWAKLVQMEVGHVGVLKEGAKSIFGKKK